MKKIDETAKTGDREKAVRMLENLLKKVPEEKSLPLVKKRKKLKKELAAEKRIIALEQKYAT
ncbi:hypothetical protein CSA37_08135 [Candidatus Fermentibacteria bacterium]|nr:MAG: hypothetical protein CSA37_08135 [Candidatus Fermentibacteria bacterium]